MSSPPELQLENTDRELWREREGDFYANSIHVTKQGGIGINVGGYVYVKPLEAWFELAGGKTPFLPALAAAPSNGAAQERRSDPDCVICPACCHEFRAIPENVQAMLAAPPSAEPVARDLHRGGDSYEASMLRNLLARIHRDGGHYVEQHGLDKALDDAEAIIVAGHVRDDAAPSADEVKRLADALRWYADEAKAIAKNSLAKNDQALLASMTVLALDAGKRADDALCNPGEAP